MKKFLLLTFMSLSLISGVKASDRENRVSLSTGLLYERGWDTSFAIEHETRYHNVWEYSANLYLRWEECGSCGHVCPESFWNSYNTWTIGITYKAAVSRDRNKVGLLRMGGVLGSDTRKILGGVHVGYEYDYVLRHGTVLFWELKSDLVINGRDLFRTGGALGIKIPIRK